MKTTKTILICALFTLVLASCEKKSTLPALSGIYGTYNGTLSAGGSSMGAYTTVTKINDNLVSMGIGQTGQPVSMQLDSVTVTAGTTNYALSKTGGFTGTIDGTNLTWNDPYYNFTGTK